MSSTSRRGVIRPRAERSARRMTPEIIARSSLSSTPAPSASAMMVLTSSSVTRSSVSPAWPSSAQHQPARHVEQPDQRRGDRRDERHDRRDARGDALGIAQRDLLGHQLADDQRQVGDDDDDEADAERRRRCCRRRRSTRARAVSRAPSVAPEKAPDSTPTSVMPICTEERNLPGSSASFRATSAPLLPSCAMTLSRAGRDETTASSDIANAPLSRVSTTTMRISTINWSRSAAAPHSISGRFGGDAYSGTAAIGEWPIANAGSAVAGAASSACAWDCRGRRTGSCRRAPRAGSACRACRKSSRMPLTR